MLLAFVICDFEMLEFVDLWMLVFSDLFSLWRLYFWILGFWEFTVFLYLGFWGFWMLGFKDFGIVGDCLYLLKLYVSVYS